MLPCSVHVGSGDILTINFNHGLDVPTKIFFVGSRDIITRNFNHGCDVPTKIFLNSYSIKEILTETFNHGSASCNILHFLSSSFSYLCKSYQFRGQNIQQI